MLNVLGQDVRKERYTVYVFDIVLYFAAGLLVAGLLFMMLIAGADSAVRLVADMTLFVCGVLMALIVVRFLMLTGVM